MSFNSDDVELRSFAKEFLKEYMADGFTSLPKKEIDLLVLRLLLEQKKTWKDKRPAAFELAKQLGVKRSRILSMLDDLSYRQADERDALIKLVEILKHGEIVGTNENQVKFQVEDGFIRECAKQIIKDDYGVVDSSFDRTVVTLTADKFLFLVSQLLVDEDRERLLKELEARKKEFGSPKKEELLKAFASNFVAGAGSEAGKKTIELGFGLLNGKWTKGLFSAVFSAV